MIILSTTADVIRLVTTSANALDVHASWVDNQAATATPYTPGRSNTAIAAAATTTVLGSPAAATQRQLKKFMACARGGANTVTVEFYDGTTAFRQMQVALAVGEALEYEDLAGWIVRDGTGSIKTTGLGPGRLIRAPQVLTSGTSYNPPAGCNGIMVELVGAGGGGGGVAAAAAGQIALAVGGGSGGYAARFYANPPAACTYAIGAAGVAGNNAGAVAGTGGATTFTDGTTLVTANGGIGAPASIATGTTDVWSLGGAGAAISTNGNVNQGGQPGDPANRCVNTGLANQGISGSGGPGPWGGQGIGRITTGAGNNAVANSGAGGGGALALA
ncbi:MAG TPA: hypothetical protein VMS92_21675, partial [Mycobacterium sp.]|nr:hypothetical protein [Mycobacterium sp.]